MTKKPIPMPEAGEGAIVVFSLDDLEKLDAEANKAEASDGWWRDALNALDKMKIPHIRRLLLVGLKGGDPDAAFRALPLMEIGQRILDALMITVYGRTAEEQEAFQLEQARKKQARLLEAARLQMEVAK